MHGYGQVVYDGFGNPVGMIPGIDRLINLFRGNQPAPPSLANALRRFAPGVPPRPIRPFAPPVGWVTAALPYTGVQPRRMYLRCSAWPGPAGMVPAMPMQQPNAPGAGGGRGRGR